MGTADFPTIKLPVNSDFRIKQAEPKPRLNSGGTIVPVLTEPSPETLPVEDLGLGWLEQTSEESVLRYVTPINAENDDPNALGTISAEVVGEDVSDSNLVQPGPDVEVPDPEFPYTLPTPDGPVLIEQDGTVSVPDNS